MFDSKYTSDKLEMHEGLDGIRHSPAMYIGNIESPEGARNMFFEIFSNSIDEAIAGHANQISVKLFRRNIVSVSDNGRGIPFDLNKKHGLSGVEMIFTKTHAGGKFSADNYKVSSGLHGMGATVVNALSRWVRVYISNGTQVHKVIFHRGIKVYENTIAFKTNKGSHVSFCLDRDIFHYGFTLKSIQTELIDNAFLLPGVKFKLCTQEDNYQYLSHRGLAEYLEISIGKTSTYGPIITINDETKEGSCFVNLCWIEKNGFVPYLWCNNTRQTDGTHLTGFKRGIARGLTKYIAEFHQKLAPVIEANDIREGLVTAIAVKSKDAKYASQTKERLVTQSIRKLVEDAVFEGIYRYMIENPIPAKNIITKITRSSLIRRRMVELKSTIVKSEQEGLSVMPGTLSDCRSKDLESNEIYLVEGLSAAATLKDIRNKEYQAVLPLRGKVINAYKHEVARLMKNDIVQNIVNALGIGAGLLNGDLSKLRYGKIIIAADPDVDGKHIVVLAYTLFYVLSPALYSAGRVFMAEPPLYAIKSQGKLQYYYSDLDLLKRYLALRYDKYSLTDTEFNTLEAIYSRSSHININNLDALEAILIAKRRHIQSFYSYPNKHITYFSEQSQWVIKTNGLVTNYEAIADALIKPFSEELVSAFIKIRVKIGEPKLLASIHSQMHAFKNSASVKRFKGLGELEADELDITCVRPESRSLKKLEISDWEDAGKTIDMFMGKDISDRKACIISKIHEELS
jgi:DNA gyrase subunit B